MIRRYDREMFERYNSIQARKKYFIWKTISRIKLLKSWNKFQDIKAEYVKEKRELRDIEAKLEVFKK